MRDAHNGNNEPGVSPNSEGAGNDAWQRTKFLMAQLAGRGR
jgi:hypothetical protein